MRKQGSGTCVDAIADLAYYVIYTSGASGRPKGEQIPHQAGGQFPQRDAIPEPYQLHLSTLLIENG